MAVEEYFSATFAQGERGGAILVSGTMKQVFAQAVLLASTTRPLAPQRLAQFGCVGHRALFSPVREVSARALTTGVSWLQ